MQLFLFNKKPSPKRIFPAQSRAALKEILAPCLPSGAVDPTLLLFERNPVHLKIVKRRHSKSGDYRQSYNGCPARISVNGDLNPSAFLITLIHELAHHAVWTELSGKRAGAVTSGRSYKPHGIAWKNTFRELMIPFLKTHIFPSSVLPALTVYLENPRASTYADPVLSGALKEQDPDTGQIHLEDLPPETVFSIHNGKRFRKKEKLRKRYRCICLQTQRIYLISPLASVIPVSREQ